MRFPKLDLHLASITFEVLERETHGRGQRNRERKEERQRQQDRERGKQEKGRASEKDIKRAKSDRQTHAPFVLLLALIQ
jgi:hypothetical protein